jgi:hypothetical protein
MGNLSKILTINSKETGSIEKQANFVIKILLDLTLAFQAN